MAGRWAGAPAVPLRSGASVHGRPAPRDRHRRARGYLRSRARRWDRNVRRLGSGRWPDDRDRDSVRILGDLASPRHDRREARGDSRRGRRRRHGRSGRVRLFRAPRRRKPAGVRRSAVVPSAARRARPGRGSEAGRRGRACAEHRRRRSGTCCRAAGHRVERSRRCASGSGNRAPGGRHRRLRHGGQRGGRERTHGKRA
jgi:hypothetical protein